MLEELEKYRQMEKTLTEIRHKNKFNNSKEEDQFLEEMDIQWNKLTLHERKLLWEMKSAIPLSEGIQ